MKKMAKRFLKTMILLVSLLVGVFYTPLTLFADSRTDPIYVARDEADILFLIDQISQGNMTNVDIDLQNTPYSKAEEFLIKDQHASDGVGYMTGVTEMTENDNVKIYDDPYSEFYLMFYNSEEALAHLREANEEAKKIAKKCKRNTEKATMNAVVKYLHKNITYDNSVSTFDKFSVYAALVKKRTVCGGFAAATTMVAKYCGIPSSYIVVGKPPYYNHAFTVYMTSDDKYYLCDSTWGAKSVKCKWGKPKYLSKANSLGKLVQHQKWEESAESVKLRLKWARVMINNPVKDVSEIPTKQRTTAEMVNKKEEEELERARQESEEQARELLEEMQKE